MPFFRHFYIREAYEKELTYRGSSDEHMRIVHAQLEQPAPYVVFCPVCGDIWARLPVVNSDREWQIRGGYCERHRQPTRFIIPGSLILDWEPELTAILPDAVVIREFNLHMRLWEKENGEVGSRET